MKWHSLAGIALLLFPLELWSGNNYIKEPLIRSAKVYPSYHFTGQTNPIRSFQPEAEMSSRYFISDYGRVGIALELKPAPRLQVFISGDLTSVTANETFYFNYLEPMNYEVPFEEFSGSASIAAQLSEHWSLNAGGSLLSAVQPRMVWVEMNLGGEYVPEARPYHDGLAYLGTAATWEHAAIEANAGAGRFHGAWAYQGNLSGAWIPFSSGSTRVGGRISYLADSLSRSGRFLWGADLDQLVAGKLRAQASCAFGWMQNYWDESTGQIMNMYDPITSRYYLGISVPDLTNHLSLSAGYTLARCVSSWSLYEYGSFTGSENKTYSANQIRVSLVWKF
jgi:hypothetical protein